MKSPALYTALMDTVTGERSQALNLNRLPQNDVPKRYARLLSDGDPRPWQGIRYGRIGTPPTEQAYFHPHFHNTNYYAFLDHNRDVAERWDNERTSTQVAQCGVQAETRGVLSQNSLDIMQTAQSEGMVYIGDGDFDCTWPRQGSAYSNDNVNTQHNIRMSRRDNINGPVSPQFIGPEEIQWSKIKSCMYLGSSSYNGEANTNFQNLRNKTDSHVPLSVWDLRYGKGQSRQGGSNGSQNPPNFLSTASIAPYETSAHLPMWNDASVSQEVARSSERRVHTSRDMVSLSSETSSASAVKSTTDSESETMSSASAETNTASEQPSTGSEMTSPCFVRSSKPNHWRGDSGTRNSQNPWNEKCNEFSEHFPNDNFKDQLQLPNAQDAVFKSSHVTSFIDHQRGMIDTSLPLRAFPQTEKIPIDGVPKTSNANAQRPRLSITERAFVTSSEYLNVGTSRNSADEKTVIQKHRPSSSASSAKEYFLDSNPNNLHETEEMFEQQPFYQHDIHVHRSQLPPFKNNRKISRSKLERKLWLSRANSCCKETDPRIQRQDQSSATNFSNEHSEKRGTRPETTLAFRFQDIESSQILKSENRKNAKLCQRSATEDAEGKSPWIRTRHGFVQHKKRMDDNLHRFDPEEQKPGQAQLQPKPFLDRMKQSHGRWGSFPIDDLTRLRAEIQRNADHSHDSQRPLSFGSGYVSSSESPPSLAPGQYDDFNTSPSDQHDTRPHHQFRTVYTNSLPTYVCSGTQYRRSPERFYNNVTQTPSLLSECTKRKSAPPCQIDHRPQPYSEHVSDGFFARDSGLVSNCMETNLRSSHVSPIYDDVDIQSTVPTLPTIHSYASIGQDSVRSFRRSNYIDSKKPAIKSWKFDHPNSPDRQAVNSLETRLCPTSKILSPKVSPDTDIKDEISQSSHTFNPKAVIPSDQKRVTELGRHEFDDEYDYRDHDRYRVSGRPSNGRTLEPRRRPTTFRYKSIHPTPLHQTQTPSDFSNGTGEPAFSNNRGRLRRRSIGSSDHRFDHMDVMLRDPENKPRHLLDSTQRVGDIRFLHHSRCNNKLPEEKIQERNFSRLKSSEENWWKLIQGEGQSQGREESAKQHNANEDPADIEACCTSISEDYEFRVTTAKLHKVMAMLKDSTPKDNYIQTLENCLSSSRTLLKSHYNVSEATLDGRPGFSGSLHLDNVFLARDQGLRKKDLKHAVYEKAFRVLTSETLEQILARKDPGPESTLESSRANGEATEGGIQTWEARLEKLCDWLKGKTAGNAGPINLLLTGFRKSRCDLKYTMEVEPVHDSRGVHLITTCKFLVEDKLLSSAVALGKREAKTKACRKALDLLTSQDLDSVVKIISTNDGKDTQEEAENLIEERSKHHDPSDTSSVLDALIAKLKQHATIASTPYVSTVDPGILDTPSSSDKNSNGREDAVTLVSKLCIQMKVKLTIVFKRVPGSETKADDHFSSPRKAIACLVYVADRLLASCQSSSRRDAHLSAFQETHSTLMVSTGNELLTNFSMLMPEDISAPEVIDVVYKGHTKTTESNRCRFHRLHKQPETSRHMSELVLMEHQDWSTDRFKHAHCILSQSATHSGLLLEWTVDQGHGSFSCEVQLQGETVSRCVATTRRDAVNLACAQALFSFYETQPIVQVFQPEYSTMWVTRNMILQGTKKSRLEETVIDIEETSDDVKCPTDLASTQSSTLDNRVAASIERHVTAFFHQSTLREFVSSPDWTPAERNHLRHVAYVRGLRCYTASCLKGEMAVLSMRLDLLEHVAILKKQPNQSQGRYRLLPHRERPSRGDIAGELAANESVFVRVKKSVSSSKSTGHGEDGSRGDNELDESEIAIDTETSHYMTANTTWESNISTFEDVTKSGEIARVKGTLDIKNALVSISPKLDSGNTKHVRIDNENSLQSHEKDSGCPSKLPLETCANTHFLEHGNTDDLPMTIHAPDGHVETPSSREMARVRINDVQSVTIRHLASIETPTPATRPSLQASTPGKPRQEKAKRKDKSCSFFASVVSPVLSLSPSTSNLLASCRKKCASPCRPNKSDTQIDRLGIDLPHMEIPLPVCDAPSHGDADVKCELADVRISIDIGEEGKILHI